ncbi:hypothetical protein BDW02DRAFT_598684 [Decorospora gaudefroyi]|uniref:Uncharacterized protein n=1 Tax=Decorospora gaudefroyi TaxID=184978 RepID=A0A6A5KEH4_9PLEO|nr:hypothetical protein BDW02DRAFT_598684 [Decorospora gaudefroyi]
MLASGNTDGKSLATDDHIPHYTWREHPRHASSPSNVSAQPRLQQRPHIVLDSIVSTLQDLVSEYILDRSNNRRILTIYICQPSATDLVARLVPVPSSVLPDDTLTTKFPETCAMWSEQLVPGPTETAEKAHFQILYSVLPDPVSKIVSVTTTTSVMTTQLPKTRAMWSEQLVPGRTETAEKAHFQILYCLTLCLEDCLGDHNDFGDDSALQLQDGLDAHSNTLFCVWVTYSYSVRTRNKSH